jgi:hypothetical protein
VPGHVRDPPRAPFLAQMLYPSGPVAPASSNPPQRSSSRTRGRRGNPPVAASSRTSSGGASAGGRMGRVSGGPAPSAGRSTSAEPCASAGGIASDLAGPSAGSRARASAGSSLGSQGQASAASASLAAEGTGASSLPSPPFRPTRPTAATGDPPVRGGPAGALPIGFKPWHRNEISELLLRAYNGEADVLVNRASNLQPLDRGLSPMAPSRAPLPPDRSTAPEPLSRYQTEAALRRSGDERTRRPRRTVSGRRRARRTATTEPNHPMPQRAYRA